MLRKTVVLVLMITVPSAGAALGDVPEVVSGKVFLDANANGRPDADEKGIAGARVTDGVNFVTTAADGSYKLVVAKDETIPYRPAQVVSVCWPTGKWPTGTWWYRLSEVKDARNVNFPLREDRQALPFIYMHITDDHGGFAGSHKDFAAFLDNLGGEVKFVVNTGDMGGPKAMADAEKSFKAPFFHAIGNHDTHGDDTAPPDERGYAPYTAHLGPVRWSFDYAGVHFAGVDVPDPTALAIVADWLERDLKPVAPGTRIVLFYHYPNPAGCAKFLKVIRDHKVALIHAGHNHAYQYWEHFAAPMFTAFSYRPRGTGNTAVVSRDGIDNTFCCLGCTKGGEEGAHSRRCPMGWLDHILMPCVRGQFGRLQKIENQPLAGQHPPLAVSTARAFIQAQIAPGEADTVGLKIGPKDKPCEITYGGDRLAVAGASVPFKLADGETLNLTIFVQRNLLTVWAGSSFFFEKTVKLERAEQVAPFASGGKATIRALAVHDVKPDSPPSRDTRYYCACAHGALRRSP